MSAADQLRSITPEGHERLRAKLAELTTMRRSEVARWLRDARDGGGGLEDNLDHAEALDEHALLERRVATLRNTPALVEVIDYKADGTAGIGAHVRLRMPSGDTIGYQLVGSAEADPSRRRISIESPVGTRSSDDAGETSSTSTRPAARTASRSSRSKLQPPRPGGLTGVSRRLIGAIDGLAHVPALRS